MFAAGSWTAGSQPLSPGAHVSPSAAGASGAPSPGRAPRRSCRRLGARDRAPAVVPWPPEFSEGFHRAPASESSPGRFLKSTGAGAPPRTVTACPPRGLGPCMSNGLPGAFSGALGSGKRRHRISAAPRESWRPASPCRAPRACWCGASRSVDPPSTRPCPGRTPREGAALIPDPPPRFRALHLLSKLDNFPSQEDPVLERYFKGHKAAITSVDFNPNGKQLGKFDCLFSFCDGANAQLVGNLASGPRWVPGETLRTDVGAESGGRRGCPARGVRFQPEGARGGRLGRAGPGPPSRTRAVVWVATFAN